MITHTKFMVDIPCWFSGEDSALTVEGLGSIPGQVTKIPGAVWSNLKKKRKRRGCTMSQVHTRFLFSFS